MSASEPPDAESESLTDHAAPESQVPSDADTPPEAESAIEHADAAVQRAREAAEGAAKSVEAVGAAVQRLRILSATTEKEGDADAGRRSAVVGERVPQVERAASRRRRQLQQEALPAVRATAEKWAATTAVLFTALGFATIIQGRKQIRGLASGYEDLTAGVFLAAFALALISILFAAWAAQGASPLRALKLPDERMLDYESARARAVGKWLGASRLLSALAIVGVLTGLGLLFYAPSDDSADGPQVLVATRDGNLICGILISESDAGEFVIDPGRNEPRSVVRADTALTVTAVNACPAAAADEPD
ncbi:MAG: hypothetical protein M3295_08630 [Chloroflexota bacterium]|nr:hypothetical protein [Chloroflexota bacterium]